MFLQIESIAECAMAARGTSPALRNHKGMSLSRDRNCGISADSSDHQSLSSLQFLRPNSPARLGLCMSPSSSNTFDRLCLANVIAKFAATKLFPSFTTLLVTCNDFISFWRRIFSRRVTRARNFSAPKLLGSVRATKPGSWRYLYFQRGNAVEFRVWAAVSASNSAGCGNKAAPGCPLSFSICWRAS